MYKVCDGVNEGCCQFHSRVVLALGKAQHALIQVCVWVCVSVFIFFVFLNLNCLNVITEQQSVHAAFLYGYQSLTLNLISNSNHLPSMMTGPLPKSPCIILTCFSPLHLYN